MEGKNDARLAAAEARVGTVVGGRYRLEGVLGIGHAATVFEGFHELTLRRTAIKLIHPWIVEGSDNAVQRYMREAQATARVCHPGLVEVFDAGVDADGTLYLFL